VEDHTYGLKLDCPLEKAEVLTLYMIALAVVDNDRFGRQHLRCSYEAFIETVTISRKLVFVGV
jgi:hypothetical protein